MRIFFITIASVVALAILIMMARIWGMGQAYQSFEHPFFAGSTPLIIVKADTLSAAQEALKLRPDAVLWLDVRYSREKIPFILPASRDKEFLNAKAQEQEKNPATPIMIGAKLSEYPWEQINEFYKDTPALKEYYEQLPQARFILNLIDNVSEAHTALVEAIKGFKPNDRTLIQSDALILMTSTKELKPEWVYGTSVPDLMRLLTFDSMFILPSIQFKGDVFISPFTLKKRPAFNDNIIEEMRRQKKRLFLGPIQNEAQLAEASRLKAEGYITENLSEMLRLLGQGPAK